MYVTQRSISDLISALKETFFITLAHKLVYTLSFLLPNQTSLGNRLGGHFPPVHIIVAYITCQIVLCTLTPTVWSLVCGKKGHVLGGVRLIDSNEIVHLLIVLESTLATSSRIDRSIEIDGEREREREGSTLPFDAWQIDCLFALVL